MRGKVGEEKKGERESRRGREGKRGREREEGRERENTSYFGMSLNHLCHSDICI